MRLPEGYSFRKLEQNDYSNDYLETLKVLTTVGEISTEMFTDLFKNWQSLPEIYQPHVITNEKGVVVATGMLFIERKAIHQCGKVGHIEDIAVAKSEQGKKLGLSMITGLTEVAKNKECYKVILDCSPHNVKFYEKCGYKNDGIEMVKRFQ
mmetsp:Transcript_3496/g.3403  ORF Transcript_3496/g.3403 Transcript_3496/m.3403 type:complete len:151 (-) Transcript_3496:17-469(-)